MKKILFMLMLIVSTEAYSQAPKKTLVADETYYQLSGTKNFKIITSNDTVSSLISKTKKYISYSAKQRKDRAGMYWETTFVFPTTAQNEVATIINKLN